MVVYLPLNSKGIFCGLAFNADSEKGLLWYQDFRSLSHSPYFLAFFHSSQHPHQNPHVIIFFTFVLKSTKPITQSSCHAVFSVSVPLCAQSPQQWLSKATSCLPVVVTSETAQAWEHADTHISSRPTALPVGSLAPPQLAGHVLS